MDAQPLRLTAKNTFLQADPCSDYWRRAVSEPVKVQLSGDGAAAMSLEEDELASTDAGSTTPKSARSPVRSVDLESPAFISQDFGRMHGAGGIEAVDALPLRLTLKNTFLQANPCSDYWRRAVSEPVKVQLSGDGAAAGALSMEADELDSTDTGSTTSKSARSPGRSVEDLEPPPGLEAPCRQRSTESAEAKEHQRQQAPGKTVALRGVPSFYTQAAVLEELRDSGFRFTRDFDFVYLPVSPFTGQNQGCCILKFTSEASAMAFAAAFHGRVARCDARQGVFEVAFMSTAEFEAVMSAAAWQERKAAAAAPPPQRMLPRFCPQCGHQVDAAKYNFCSQCGSSVAALRQRR